MKQLIIKVGDDIKIASSESRYSAVNGKKANVKAIKGKYLEVEYEDKSLGKGFILATEAVDVGEFFCDCVNYDSQFGVCLVFDTRPEEECSYKITLDELGGKTDEKN